MTSSTSYLQGRKTKLICLFLALWGLPALSIAEEAPIRFGLTAVVVTENLRFLDQWSEYLESKMGREVELVMRRSYREVMDLLDSGAIDFAWICGFPYVQKREPESLRLLSVPIYRGEPRYYSYIIVPRDSPYRKFSDLKGKIFAFSDPDSNSGYLYPLSLLATKDEKPGTYFRQTAWPVAFELDTQALEQAWQRVFDRHPILRTIFLWEGRERPLQVVRQKVELRWRELDWSDFEPPEQERRLAELLENDRREPFDLKRAPLSRLVLVRLGSGRADKRAVSTSNPRGRTYVGAVRPLAWCIATRACSKFSCEFL